MSTEHANRDCPSCGGKGTVSMRPECAKCGDAWWGRDEAVRGDLARASVLEQKVLSAEAAHAETTRRLGEANKRLDLLREQVRHDWDCTIEETVGKPGPNDKGACSCGATAAILAVGS